MATAGSESYHHYPLKSGHPYSGVHWIRWETNGASDPDGVVTSETGELSVTRASKNVYTVTCAHKWARIVLISCNKNEVSATTLQWNGATEGYTVPLNGGSCRIINEANTLEAVESNDETCEVALMLSGAL